VAPATSTKARIALSRLAVVAPHKPFMTTLPPLGVASTVSGIQERQAVQGAVNGLPGRNYLFPPYHINNAPGNLSSATINAEFMHVNGLAEYDTHNLYDTMMSAASRISMENIARAAGYSSSLAPPSPELVATSDTGSVTASLTGHTN